MEFNRHFGGKSSNVWSLEGMNDFMQNAWDELSDLSGRSSCSWHNDDFDLESSMRVSASLEAVEDALHSSTSSPLVSQEILHECREWSNRFPYMRLTGVQIADPELIEESVKRKNSAPLSLSGQKMHIYEGARNHSEDALKFRETLNNSSDRRDNEEQQKKHQSTVDSLEYAVNNIIDNLAMKMWPEVLEILQGPSKDITSSPPGGIVQLPPLAVLRAPARRPRTEGSAGKIRNALQPSKRENCWTSILPRPSSCAVSRHLAQERACEPSPLPTLQEDVASTGCLLIARGKNPGGFLPPICTPPSPSSTKLTKNLLTFLESEIAPSRHKDVLQKPRRHNSRPNTSSSQKAISICRQRNEENDKNKSLQFSKRVILGSTELFPIVTSVNPRTTKKAHLNTKR